MLIKNSLAKLREKRKQSEIAAIAGVSQGVYSMAETGQAVLPLEALHNLCLHYDVEPIRVYPEWVLCEVYALSAEPPKPKVKTTVAVKIPIALAEEIDELITNGQYINRADFVVTAVRGLLHE